ncbi:MAG: Crp/Fnr family transcriptional regulator [Pseudomonadota bacterium]
MKIKRKLLHVFDELSAQDRATLLSFAEFLHARTVPVSTHIDAQPQLIAASPDESVIGALKRLAASYPMLDKSKLLDQTSMLIAQHTLQGRSKAEVIADLEAIFQRSYAKHRADEG